MRMNRLFGLMLCASIASSSSARAQGVQTGTLTGIVQSTDGLSLPGVSVTATSPSLQGQRTAVTDVNGVYFIKGLPAGTYSLKFNIQSVQTATADSIVLVLGGGAEVNQTLMLAGRTEVVSVTAEAPSPIATTTLGQAFTKAQVDTLPVGRRPQDIAELAPGLTNVTPNASQVTIAGATAFDNVFMLNGQRDPTPNTFVQTGGSYTRVDTIKRGEIKLTGTFAPNQTLSGDFTTNSTVQKDRPSLNASFSLDPSTLVTERIPNNLFVTTYNGVLSQKFFTTLQYSRKKFKFEDAGGTKTEITASPFRTRGVVAGVPPSLHYAAPFFS
jgi:Carboxypeptidase regulatory-like domain